MDKIRHTTSWAEIGLLSLTSVFGMQALRTLPRVIFFTFRWMPGVSHLDMVLLAFGVFLVSFLSAIVRRFLGPRVALTLTAGGVAAACLVEQLSISPTLDLISVTTGTGLFVLFLLIYLGHLRGRGLHAMARYGIGLLLGLALDSALRGVWDALLLSQQSRGLLLFALTMALTLLQLGCLARVLPDSGAQTYSDGSFLHTLPVLVLGPFLLTQVLLYQNAAYLTVLSNWPRPAVLGWVVAMNVLGMAAAVFVVSHVRRLWWAAVVLVASGATLVPIVARQGGGTAVVAITFGHAVVAGMLALICVSLGAHATHPGLKRTAIAGGVGMFLFVFLVFILSFVVLPSPYNDTVSLPCQLATIIMVLCTLGAARMLPNKALAKLVNWRPVGVALLLLVLLVPMWLIWHRPSYASGKGFPVRVMTYNLHCGLNGDGQLSLEAQARVIEESQADIVGAQEVSRGLLGIPFDMLAWLSQRLDMPYVYGPTEILAQGNAILSRHPIREWGYDLLPTGEERVQGRGYLWANVDLGEGQELLVIVAHLHSSGAEVSPVRSPQVATLLDQWQEQQPAIIMGDMNAHPDMPEMALFRAAGLRDACMEAGAGNGYTFPATAPQSRIDYIWLSADLTVSNIVIPPDAASDHLGVAATLNLK
jgi:endonuclease/exonuclease/phosphatase family metal-dependent hydrolase